MKLHDLKNLDRHDLLALLGVETKHSMSGRLFTALGTLAVGLIVGAGVALLLAPKPGRELRQDIRAKARAAKGETDGAHGAAADFTSREG